jgi:hypothetical protein
VPPPDVLALGEAIRQTLVKAGYEPTLNVATLSARPGYGLRFGVPGMTAKPLPSSLQGSNLVLTVPMKPSTPATGQTGGFAPTITYDVVKDDKGQPIGTVIQNGPPGKAGSTVQLTAPAPALPVRPMAEPIAYNPPQTLNAAINATATTIQATGSVDSLVRGIEIGDVIKVDAEEMQVLDCRSVDGGITSVSVTRGGGVPAPVAHASGADILLLVSQDHTPSPLGIFKATGSQIEITNQEIADQPPPANAAANPPVVVVNVPYHVVQGPRGISRTGRIRCRRRTGCALPRLSAGSAGGR